VRHEITIGLVLGTLNRLYLCGTFGMELVESLVRTATYDTVTAAGSVVGQDRTQQEMAGTQNSDEGRLSPHLCVNSFKLAGNSRLFVFPNGPLEL
jgi:hypothetical protein